MKWIVSLLILGLLSLVVYDRLLIDKISQELALAQDQISQLNKANSFTSKRKQITFVKRDQSRVKMFGFLYELNKERKRIRYLPGELIIEDLKLSQNDQFLDLLDLLFEQEQLMMIELPENNAIKEDLRSAGFTNDYLSKSIDGKWRIRIKE